MRAKGQPPLIAAAKRIRADEWFGWWDTADKSQSGRHIPCAVHLESRQMSRGGRHDGACLLLLLSAASVVLSIKWCVPTLYRPAGRKLQASDVELKGYSHSLDQMVQQPNEPSTNDGDVATIDRKQIAQKPIASTKQQSKMLAMNALLSAASLGFS